MKISRANRADIKKYYQDTLIKLKETDDRVWYVADVTDTCVSLTDAYDTNVHIDLSEEYEIEYVLPTRAIFQRGDVAVCLSRTPAQQFKRGMAQSNTGFFFLRKDGTWRMADWDITLVQDFVDKPSYLAVHDHEHSSMAINPQFAMSKNGMIFAGLTKVGRVVWEKNKVYCDKMFTKEITAMFPKLEVR